MGGSISAEHGIGQMKRDELARVKSDVELDLMRRIKAALDPQGHPQSGQGAVSHEKSAVSAGCWTGVTAFPASPRKTHDWHAPTRLPRGARRGPTEVRQSPQQLASSVPAGIVLIQDGVTPEADGPGPRPPADRRRRRMRSHTSFGASCASPRSDTLPVLYSTRLRYARRRAPSNAVSRGRMRSSTLGCSQHVERGAVELLQARADDAEVAAGLRPPRREAVAQQRAGRRRA